MSLETLQSIFYVTASTAVIIVLILSVAVAVYLFKFIHKVKKLEKVGEKYLTSFIVSKTASKIIKSIKNRKR